MIESKSASRKGVALLLVVVVLVTLLIVGTAFGVSMVYHEKCAITFGASLTSDRGAESAKNYCVMKAMNALSSRDDTPEYDVRNEFSPTPAELARLSDLLDDPRAIVSAVVEDEQGKININYSNRYLTGNVIGSCVVLENMTDSDTQVTIDSAENIDPEGGYLVLDRERVAYSEFSGEGSSITNLGVTGRGAFDTVARAHRVGTLAVDLRAVIVAERRAYYSAESETYTWTNFRNLDDVKRLFTNKTLNDMPLNLTCRQSWYEKKKKPLTCWSTPVVQAGWTGPRPLDHPYTYRVENPNTGEVTIYILVSDATFIEIGSLVEISGPAFVYYDTVDSVTFYSGAGLYYCRLSDAGDRNVNFGYDLSVRVLSRARININTASAEVLEALFYGLSIPQGTPQDGSGSTFDYVERQEARDLAEYIVTVCQSVEETDVDNVLYDESDLVELLEDALNDNLISSGDVPAILGAIAPGAEGAGSPLFRTGRICFDTGGVFGIEAACSVNSPGGDQICLKRIREVVAVSPPEPETIEFETQADFQRLFNPDVRTGSFTITTEFHNGSAHCWRTYPEFHNPPDEEFASAEESGTGVRPAASPLPSSPGNFRSNVMLTVDSKDEPSAGLYGPYDGTGKPEGLVVDGRMYPLLSVEFTGFLRRETGYICQDPTGFSLWFKCDESPAGAEVYLLDILVDSEEDDRVRLYYDGGAEQLVLGMYDMTVGDNEAEWRADLVLEAGEWHYVQVLWKGNGPRGMMMYIDGEPAGRYSLTGYLAQDMTAADQSIVLDDASAFPEDGGVVRVDSEWIEYESRTGDVLNIASGKRARRLSPEATEHYEGAAVHFFGYAYDHGGNYQVAFTAPDGAVAGTRDVDNTLYTNGGFLADAIGDNPDTSVYNVDDEFSPSPITASQTYIPVADTAGFQGKGYILLGNGRVADGYEIVYYDALGTQGPGAASFDNCTRGALGTTARMWNNGTNVRLFSLWVTDTANYPDVCALQVEDEWMGHYQKDVIDNRPGFFIGFIEGGIAFRPRRGIMGTQRAAHDTASEVVQIFRIVHKNDTGQDDWSVCRAGKGDVVTIINSDLTREEHTVNHQSWLLNMDWDDPDVQDRKFFIAFTTHTQRIYSTATQSRVLKFPSGENQRQIPNTFYFLTDFEGSDGLVGTVDEVGFGSPYSGTTSLLFRNAWTNVNIEEGIGTGDTDITVFADCHANPDLADWFAGSNTFTFDDKEAGLIKIGDEWIAYTEVDMDDNPWTNAADGREYPRVTLLDVKRGVFDTTPGEHLAGAEVYVDYGTRIGVYKNLFEFGPNELNYLEDGNAGFIPLWGTQLSKRLPSNGYMKVFKESFTGREILGYTGRLTHGLLMPVSSQSDPKPIYRARFGTLESTLSGGDILVYVPVRYHHRYNEIDDHPSMSYFNLLINGLRGKWASVDYAANVPAGTSLIAKGRFNSTPAWNSSLGSTPAEGAVFNVVSGMNLLAQSDQLEIRFYYDYYDRAWENGYASRIPEIENLSVTVRRACRVLYHKELYEQ